MLFFDLVHFGVDTSRKHSNEELSIRGSRFDFAKIVQQEFGTKGLAFICSAKAVPPGFSQWLRQLSLLHDPSRRIGEQNNTRDRSAAFRNGFTGIPVRDYHQGTPPLFLRWAVLNELFLG